MDSKTLRIALVIVVILIVIAMLALAGRSRSSGDHYLVYPYLDLDEPGERGSYYALSEGCP